MRILVVGAGATGGFYGGLLHRAGKDVTFLLRETRAQQLRQHGLTLVPYHGEPITVQPNIITAAELRTLGPVFDLIILSTKAYQLAAAMDDVAPAVGPDTLLLPILNGMQQLAALDARFGAERVLGGSVRIVSYLDAEGRIVQMTALDHFNYGERSGERTPRILAMDAALQNAGFTSTLQPDILATMWAKWWFLSSLGAICVLGGGTIGDIASVPYGKQLALAVLDECTAVALRNGYPPSEALVAEHLQRFTDASSILTSSLYRDMSKGAPVEADHILGDLLAHAEGVAAPLFTAAYVRLKVYEADRKAAA